MILKELEESVRRLFIELQVLNQEMLYHKEGMYIAHDGIETLLVYADKKYKAYIPKRFDDWDVRFIEWDGGEIDLDIDEEIYTG